MTDATRRGLRTAVQALVTLITALPLLAADPGVADVPVLAGLVALAAALSRLMAVPAVEALLPPWLRRRGVDDGGS
ncbi:hypothetical protein [Streptomyces venezuelae]|uniref:Holin n=1 Tax=Streptomyces venezuelae TaxID=54571 RepID=A0A5P2BYA9_STRVZ|nr:hypothetical protein [Streptomyces venezuelae]QES35474.1 hypothetical protein DEJ48_20385 [Streptomyces venezuelae]